MNPFLQELIAYKGYVQAAPARPVFISPLVSLDWMKHSLGFSFSRFYSVYKEDYGTAYYPEAELAEIGRAVEQKLAKNSEYFKQKRKQYEKEMRQFQRRFFKTILPASKVTTRQLFRWLAQLDKDAEQTVGTAHLIEGIGPRLESKIRHFLLDQEKGPDANADFSILTSPTKPSFVLEIDSLLWKIKQARPKQRPQLVRHFLSRFFWSKSSHMGSQHWTPETVLQEAKGLTDFRAPNFRHLRAQKKIRMRKYGFSAEQRRWIAWIEFLADWQDKRKGYMYWAIFALHNILRELAMRYSVDEKLLHYAMLSEITESSLKDSAFLKILQKRIQGCIFTRQPGKKRVFDGVDFLDYEKMQEGHIESPETLSGQCAAIGNATGPVRILTTMDTMNRIQAGDILVASMTRPEFVPAMKKAAAVVTDEGGITSHAAIVSRELGIPCVIGTKNATKILKDGWIVQVKAGHGQVIVLEKGKNDG